jgi:hypothetical protein
MTHDSSFGTSLRRDPTQPPDLRARIDAQMRERLEEAVDFVCLDALVQRRRALALAPPSADNPRDREEFTRSVRAFLAELYATIAATLGDEQRRAVAVAERTPGDETERLLRVHVMLARALPDYWQRFETMGTRFVAERRVAGERRDAAEHRDAAERRDSGSERRGLLGWLFGRG